MHMPREHVARCAADLLWIGVRERVFEDHLTEPTVTVAQLQREAGGPVPPYAMKVVLESDGEGTRRAIDHDAETRESTGPLQFLAERVDRS